MAEKRVQRRLAAIVAADVVGYSRLMEQDEEGTLARLKTLRSDLLDPKVGEYGGRIFKTTGDGLLAEFPSAIDAVKHAIDVQRALASLNTDVPEDRRIAFRIGISLGDVMVDGDDLFGNGVNIAARMETLSEGGGICISGNVREHIDKTLDVSLDDLGEQTVKNIERPVRTFRVRIDDGVPKRTPAKSNHNQLLPLPDKPSIAVLPFVNMSGDPEQEYFADGITEDIITALSRFRSFFVIARNSSFTYKGKAVDVRQVGSELGVRYILEGSVRKSGNRLRITGQLIEAATGIHIWADQYDGTIEDVFDVQDTVTRDIAGAIAPTVLRAEIERSRRKRPDNLDAYDLYLRALVRFRAYVVEQSQQAAALLEEVLKMDPSFIEAHALAAVVHNHLFDHFRFDRHFDAAVGHANVVLASNCDDATACAIAGLVLAQRSPEFERGRAGLERALALNPNSDSALSASAAVNSWIGNLVEAIDQAQRAIRLDPFSQQGWVARVALSRSYYLLDRYVEAADAATQGIKVNPNSIYSYIWLVASYWRLGRTEEARGAVRRILELSPGFRCSTWPGMLNSPQNHKDLVFPALREAGLPE